VYAGRCQVQAKLDARSDEYDASDATTTTDQTIQQGNHQRKRLYDECSCLLDSIMALFFFETKDNGPLAFE
jgi:hypothetical protein